MSSRHIPVSVVVMTLNEAANIGSCLDALGRFDQVFVVDSNSSDGSAAIAAAGGATVVPFAWNGRYPKKKQWCLENLPFRHDTVLFVDADERMTPCLAREIDEVLRSERRCSGYFVESRYVFMGKPLRFGLRNRKLALFDRRATCFPLCDDLTVERMWEVEGHYQPKVDGPLGRLSRSMLHADDKPLFAWFERHNRYSDWEAELAWKGGLGKVASNERLPRRIAKRLFQVVPGRPLAAFLHSYVLRLGFLDGRAGFHFALARAFYYWQVGVKLRAMKVRGARNGETAGGCKATALPSARRSSLPEVP